MTEELPKILILLGPTACGKTALSLELATRLDCEIISADSMQVYRGMDIGTAKIPYAERRGIPHHLLDVVEPEYPFSVADYRQAAAAAIDDICGRGRLPLVCGGTGLYIDSLAAPYNFSAAADSDHRIRERLNREFEEKGGAALHERLTSVDPAAAAKIHPHDSRRLIRALEVYEVAGRPISELQKENDAVRYKTVMVGLTAPREILYQRIEQRVDEMMAAGLLQEVERLMAAGLSRDAVSMQGLGYKQIAAYLAGECDLPTAAAQIKTSTKRFAKRQFTWFKRNEHIKWFSIDQYLEEGELVNAVFTWVDHALEEV